jgi:hypothetical protein
MPGRPWPKALRQRAIQWYLSVVDARQRSREDTISLDRMTVERRILQYLSQNGIRAIHREAFADLDRYSWVTSDHRVIFEALVRLENTSPVSLRERLPAEATRMGFPDIDWEAFSEVPQNEPKSATESSEWILSLIDSLKRKP